VAEEALPGGQAAIEGVMKNAPVPWGCVALFQSLAPGGEVPARHDAFPL